jgi:hypothetical protein
MKNQQHQETYLLSLNNSVKSSGTTFRISGSIACALFRFLASLSAAFALALKVNRRNDCGFLTNCPIC